MLIDIRPLRESPAFRRLWLGGALSSVGGTMTSYAVGLQIFQLTGSALAVGALGLAIAVPAILVGLAGGSVIDAVDRRRLVLLTTSGLAVVSVLLAAQAYARLDQLWLLYALVATQALFGAVNGPAIATFMPRLLPTDRLPAAAALKMIMMHASLTVGPALAGVITASWGLRTCYVIDAVSFAAALYAVARIPAMPPIGETTRPGVRAVVDGLGFVARTRVLAAAMVADLNATVLGMPFALFPAINQDRFGGDARTLGLLTTAVAVGGVLGAALSGPIARIARPGVAILAGNAVWGAGLFGFGLVGNLWLTLALLAVAGAADSMTVVFRNTILQVATPDNLRGRASAVDYVVGAACPHLGNFRAGAVGSLVSPAISAASGGIAVIVGVALIRLAFPAFVRYRIPTTPEPQPARA
ncbi:MFS transporter [Fodinicola acaciae]|uniref:MFS transporter n=1 Tax=Fodinicola acaciae TaxID=2681555 RepID=UPI0013D1DC7A|nr:MFS transporter [Fodinicola acaciae]